MEKKKMAYTSSCILHLNLSMTLQFKFQLMSRMDKF